MKGKRKPAHARTAAIGALEARLEQEIQNRQAGDDSLRNALAALATRVEELVAKETPAMPPAMPPA